MESTKLIARDKLNFNFNNFLNSRYLIPPFLLSPSIFLSSPQGHHIHTYYCSDSFPLTLHRITGLRNRRDFDYFQPNYLDYFIKLLLRLLHKLWQDGRYFYDIFNFVIILNE